MARYWPKHRYQLRADDPLRAWNCAAYSAAMFLDAVTLGGIDLTGAQVRARTDEPRGDPGSPGLNMGQVVSVIRSLGVEIGGPASSNAAGLFARARLNAPILLPVIYRHVDLELRGDRNYLGPHMVLLYQVHADRAHYRVFDPLQKVYRWWGVVMTSRAWRAYGSSFMHGRTPPELLG